MLLIPFGVIWFGYAVMYYGWTNLQGPGMGFADLIFPSRISKAEATLGSSSTSQPDATTAGTASSTPSNNTVTQGLKSQ